MSSPPPPQELFRSMSSSTSTTNSYPPRRHSGGSVASNNSFRVDIDTVIAQNQPSVVSVKSPLERSNQPGSSGDVMKSSFHDLNYEDVGVSRGGMDRFRDEEVETYGATHFLRSIVPQSTKGPDGRVYYYCGNPRRFWRCLIFFIVLAILVVTLSTTLPKRKHHRQHQSTIQQAPQDDLAPQDDQTPQDIPPPSPAPTPVPTPGPTPGPTEPLTPVPTAKPTLPVVVFTPAPTRDLPVVSFTPAPTVVFTPNPTAYPTVAGATVANPTLGNQGAPAIEDSVNANDYEQACVFGADDLDVDPYLQCYCSDFDGLTNNWSEEVSSMFSFLEGSPITDVGNTDDPSDECSPRNQALYWLALDMVFNDEHKLTTADTDRLRQRYIVAYLYGALDGDDWIFYETWLQATSECEWYGIECNGANQVTTINLASNNMTNPIPAELGYLPKLEQLELTDNFLTGTIPNELFFLENLKLLDLSSNDLSGTLPIQVVTLTNLERFSLKHNKFSGTIPETYKSLENLIELKLEDNLLTGTLPAEIFKLTHLTALSLADNPSVGGTLPLEVEFLQKLEELSLHGMNLQGELPVTLGLVKPLQRLRLDKNNFVGTLPAIYGDLSSMTYLNGEGNQLQGTIPKEYGAMSLMELLTLSDNVGIYGSIPSEFSSMTGLISAHFTNMPLLTGTVPFCDTTPPEYLVFDCTPQVTCECCTSDSMSDCENPDDPMNRRQLRG